MKCSEKCIHQYFCKFKEEGSNCDYYEEERPHGEWIPCSERLPEVGGRYIVTEKYFSIDDRKHNGRYHTIVEEVNFSNNKWNRANFIEVVAWMPLPTPYKGGEEE